MMTNVLWDQAHGIEYRVPQSADYGASVVAWQASPARSALLIHDMQRYFMERFDTVQEPAAALVSNIGRVLREARNRGVPIIYTAQPGGMTPAQRGLLADFWGPGMLQTADQRSVVDPLGPEPGDLVLDKWRYSAFLGTRLEEYLHETGRDQIVICGIYAHIGVLATALDAYSRDFETFVLADAVADFDRERHVRALDYLARIAARVVPTAELVKEWERHDDTA